MRYGPRLWEGGNAEEASLEEVDVEGKAHSQPPPPHYCHVNRVCECQLEIGVALQQAHGLFLIVRSRSDKIHRVVPDSSQPCPGNVGALVIEQASVRLVERWSSGKNRKASGSNFVQAIPCSDMMGIRGIGERNKRARIQ